MGKINWARIVPIGAGAVVVLVLLYYGVTRAWRAITPNPAYSRVFDAAKKYNSLSTTKKKIPVQNGGENIYFRIVLPGELLSAEEKSFWIERAKPVADEGAGKVKCIIDDVSEIRVFGNRQAIESVDVYLTGKYGDSTNFSVSLEYEETRASTEAWLGGWTDFLNAKVKKEAPPPPKMPPPPKKLKGLPPPPK